MDAKVIIDVAQQAGALAHSLQKHLVVTTKEDNSLLTQADLKVSTFILTQLSHHFPHDQAFTEEHQQHNINWNGRVWVVDPIDGTSAYAQGKDGWAVSMALVEQGAPVLGVVCAPALGWTAWAVKGMGAFMNEQRLRVSATSTVDEATGYVTRAEDGSKTGITLQSPKEHPYSAAAKLVLVAQGKADIYAHVRNRLSKWDTAAGHIIVLEAGGRITATDGTLLDYSQKQMRWSTGVLATNGLVHQEFIELFSS